MTRPTLSPDPAGIRLLLPSRGDEGAWCLLVDADGRIRSRERIDPRPPPASTTEPPPHDGTRCVLAVPGEAVRSLWLELPARTEAQAVAAARLLLDEHLAGAGDDLHVVVAPAHDGDTRRQVLYIEPATLQLHLDRARRLGRDVDAAVPDYMLLPPPQAPDDAGADGIAFVLAHEGRWLVRGRELAFAGEAALAQAVLAARAPATADGAVVESRDEAEAWLARGAVAPPVDLLRHRFARHDAHPRGRAAWRRAAVLAGLLLLSPLLVTAAGAIRYTLAASALRAEAVEAARALAMDPAGDADPVAALQHALATGTGGDRFARLNGALQAAMAETPGLQLERLDYDAGRPLLASVSHSTRDDLVALRRRLADRGLRLDARDSRDGADGLVSTILVHDAPSATDAPTEGTR